MTVLSEHMPPIAGLGRVKMRLADQQSFGIRAGAVGLVAEPNPAEVALGPLLAILGTPKSLTRS